MGWLTTFNDLVTLLMVFFVLLFTMSSLDANKMKQFQHSLQSGLGVLEAGKMVSIKVVNPMKAGQLGNTKDPEEAEPEGRIGPMNMKQIEETISELDAMDGISTSYSEKGVLITLENNILFQVGDADINPVAVSVINGVISVLNRFENPVRIEGHTDNVPIHTRRYPSNWELSTARAVNVVKYFVKNGKVDPRRLSAVGYGDVRPIYSNDTAEHRAGNRRVEILLKTEERKKNVE